MNLPMLDFGDSDDVIGAESPTNMGDSKSPKVNLD
jgi:hypothetical protein